jgi:hypothetical protein
MKRTGPPARRVTNLLVAAAVPATTALLTTGGPKLPPFLGD